MSLAQCFDHAFQEEIAEADATQALLRIGDRIKHGPAHARQVFQRCCLVEQSANVACQLFQEGNLDENQWLFGQARMKKRIAAPIRIEAIAQVSP